jgi:LAS superfamily LD-carboxypeptidase LdcB
MVNFLISVLICLNISSADVIEADLSVFPVLCNKIYALQPDYVPPDLVQAEGKHRLTKETEAAYIEMKAELGLDVYISSGYRSYETQQKLYQSYGADAVRFSARAGHSEHQLGTAIDLRRSDVKAKSLSEQKFEESEAYAKLMESAYLYGFIQRYPKGKESVTGYMFEPWHWTYVGREVALVCYSMEWVLEEYYDLVDRD